MRTIIIGRITTSNKDVAGTFGLQQLVTYLRVNDLLPDRQSAYRAHHSTETAVLRVLADILLALDSGNLAVLTLLDLSVAFDSVDHETLLRRCKRHTVLTAL